MLVSRILFLKIYYRFMYSNDTEYDYPHSYEVPEMPQVAGLDKILFHELHNDENPYQTDDEEDFNVGNLPKDHQDKN